MAENNPWLLSSFASQILVISLRSCSGTEEFCLGRDPPWPGPERCTNRSTAGAGSGSGFRAVCHVLQAGLVAWKTWAGTERAGPAA